MKPIEISTDQQSITLTIHKFCFKHILSGKVYVVGAPDKEEAMIMVENICGDLAFEEVPLPKQFR